MMLCAFMGASEAASFDAKKGHVDVLLGGYLSTQGQAQHINIERLIGNDFSVTEHQGSNGLVGIGYLYQTHDYALLNMAYGIKAFYLGKTSVQGNITQENMFTNFMPIRKVYVATRLYDSL